MDINTVDVPTTRAFLARIGMKKSKDGREIAERRIYEIVSAFVRMAFHEYWEDHQEWQNPFDRIKAPSRVKARPRDVLQEDEILKLFMPLFNNAIMQFLCFTALRCIPEANAV